MMEIASRRVQRRARFRQVVQAELKLAMVMCRLVAVWPRTACPWRLSPWLGLSRAAFLLA